MFSSITKHENIAIQSVDINVSNRIPHCAWSVYFKSTITPPDSMVAEGGVTIENLINKRKPRNVSESYHVRFKNAEQGTVLFMLEYDCDIPNFSEIDKSIQIMLAKL
jgi:hypothetical protein